MRRPRRHLVAIFWAAVLLPSAGYGRLPALTCKMEAEPALLTQQVLRCPGGPVRLTWTSRFGCYSCGRTSPDFSRELTTEGYGVCNLNWACKPFKESETHGIIDLKVIVRNKRYLTPFDALTCIDDGQSVGYDFCPCPQENTCDPNIGSPILLSLGDSRVALTSPENGVFFDLDGDGRQERTAWTARSSADGFLFLDRNGDGAVDGGGELFGEFTPQRPGPDGERNGFLALALFDLPASGGDGDGLLSDRDPVFRRLGVWVDSNHDGISQRREQLPLSHVGVHALGLEYRRSGRVDAYGNELRFRAPIYGAGDRRLETIGTAYDVYLVYWSETGN